METIYKRLEMCAQELRNQSQSKNIDAKVKKLLEKRAEELEHEIKNLIKEYTL